jgi:hypothetical protein
MFLRMRCPFTPTKLFMFGGNWSDQENGGSWGNASTGVDYTRPTAGITDGVSFLNILFGS